MLMKEGSKDGARGTIKHGRIKRRTDFVSLITVAVLLHLLEWFPCAFALQLNMAQVERAATLRHGVVPPWLDGQLFINGPALHDFRQFGVDVQTNHFFDGLGGVLSLDFARGEVLVRTRLIESETLRRLVDHNQYDSLTFGTPISWRSLLSRPFGVLLDNTPINLYPANGSLYATSDSSYRHQLDADTLHTLGSHSVDPLGPIGAAHPGIDPDTGEIFNYVGPVKKSFDFASFRPIGKYLLVREYHEGTTSTVLRRETIGSVWAPMAWIAHSVAVTSKYVVYRIMSERARLSADFSVLSNFLQMDPNERVQMITVDRKTHKQTTLTCNEGFSSFHVINAFQQRVDGEDQIVVDSVTSDTGLINDRTNDVFSRGYKPKHMRSKDEPVVAENVRYFMKRCTVTSDACHCTDIVQFPFELPVVNPLFKMEKHRYVWGAGGKGETLWSNSVVKFDLEGREAVVQHEWTPPEGFVSGEPRMIPHPEPIAEDHGVILVICTNESEPDSRVVVLDAATLKELCSLDLPLDLPVLTHGVFKDRNRKGKMFPN